MYGLRLESSEGPTTTEDDESAEPTLLVDSDAEFRLYGEGWTNETVLELTEYAGTVGDHCRYIMNGAKTKVYWFNLITMKFYFISFFIDHDCC